MDFHLSDNAEIDTLLNHILNDVSNFVHKQDKQIHELNLIGRALSAENNLNKLLPMILSHAKEYTNSDGGTIYLMSKDEKSLEFSVVETTSLEIYMGAGMGEIVWPALPLYKEDGSKNLEMVAVKCALEGEIVKIDDVYKTEKFNFEGTKKFDKGTGYHSQSMLVIPMKNNENEIIGVTQLINKIDKESDAVISFSQKDVEILSSLSSQAAVAITNAQLIRDLRLLLESFINSIATAIDAKSPYTGGHVRKVAEITMLIVNSINHTFKGKYKDVFYSDDQLNELRIAALMHDIGKITTPEYVVDKSTKLETIFDRIELIKTRYEVLKRDSIIALLERKIDLQKSDDLDLLSLAEKEYKEKIAQYDDDIKFLQESNIGSEFMSDDKIERLNKIAQESFIQDNRVTKLLNENELLNLSIRKGTLTEDERQIINNHAQVSLDMLNELPFPKKLRRIPEIAGAHHEKLNGTGYPLGLNASQLSLESRVLALADIFEALTASDRPYKEGKTLSDAMRIIDSMVKDGELDPNLVEFFYSQGLNLRYAKKELKKEQIDIK